MSPTSNDAISPLGKSHITVAQTPNSKRASSIIRSHTSIILAANVHEIIYPSSDTPHSIRKDPKKNVTYERQEVCKKMDEEIVTVPHALFLRDYAPWDPSEDVVEACLDELMEADLITKDRHKLSEFKKKLKNSFRSGIAAYKFIASICDAIAKAIGDTAGRLVSLRRDRLLEVREGIEGWGTPTLAVHILAGVWRQVVNADRNDYCCIVFGTGVGGTAAASISKDARVSETTL